MQNLIRDVQVISTDSVPKEHNEAEYSSNRQHSDIYS